MLILICKTKNADPDKYKHTGPGIRFDFLSELIFTDGSMGKNVITFGSDMSSSVHVDNKNKDILTLDERLARRLDDTTLKAEAKYPINFT